MPSTQSLTPQCSFPHLLQKAGSEPFSSFHAAQAATQHHCRASVPFHGSTTSSQPSSHVPWLLPAGRSPQKLHQKSGISPPAPLSATQPQTLLLQALSSTRLPQARPLCQHHTFLRTAPAPPGTGRSRYHGATKAPHHIPDVLGAVSPPLTALQTPTLPLCQTPKHHPLSPEAAASPGDPQEQRWELLVE